MITGRQWAIASAVSLVCATIGHDALSKGRNNLTPISVFDLLCIQMVRDDNLLTQLAAGASVKITDEDEINAMFPKRERESDITTCLLGVIVPSSLGELFTRTAPSIA